MRKAIGIGGFGAIALAAMFIVSTVPVVGGQPALGRWQSVFLVELDRPREREVVIQVIGL